MAGDFVAARGNVPDQLRIPLGHPSKHEESSPNINLLEDGKQFLSVADHARFTLAPSITTYVGRQGRNVKVILYINGQCVGHPLLN